MNKDLIVEQVLKGMTVDIKTIDLLKIFMKNNYFNAHILVRYLAIDNFYHKNDYGWKWYNEMQKKRVADNPQVPKYMANHQTEFEELIISFEKNGYINTNPILVNKDIMLVDGAHRIATALYFKVEKVPVKLSCENKDSVPRDYSFAWFKKQKMDFVITESLKIYDKLVEDVYEEI